MNMRLRQLWAPVLSTFLVSVSVQFVALRVPQLPRWVFFTRNGVSIVLAPLWVLALPTDRYPIELRVAPDWRWRRRPEAWRWEGE